MKTFAIVLSGLFLMASPATAQIKDQENAFLGAAIGIPAGFETVNPDGAFQETAPIGADLGIEPATIGDAGIAGPGIGVTDVETPIVETRQARRNLRAEARQARKNMRLEDRQARRNLRAANRQARLGNFLGARGADFGIEPATIGDAGIAGPGIGVTDVETPIVETRQARRNLRAEARQARKNMRLEDRQARRNLRAANRQARLGNFLATGDGGIASRVENGATVNDFSSLQPIGGQNADLLAGGDAAVQQDPIRIENVLNKASLNEGSAVDAKQGQSPTADVNMASADENAFAFNQMSALPEKFRGQSILGAPVADEGFTLESGKAALSRDGMLNMEIRGLRMEDGAVPEMDLNAMVSCLEPGGDFSTFMSEGSFPVDQAGDAVYQGPINIQGQNCLAPQVLATTLDGKAISLGSQ